MDCLLCFPPLVPTLGYVIVLVVSLLVHPPHLSDPHQLPYFKSSLCILSSSGIECLMLLYAMCYVCLLAAFVDLLSCGLY